MVPRQFLQRRWAAPEIMSVCFPVFPPALSDHRVHRGPPGRVDRPLSSGGDERTLPPRATPRSPGDEGSPALWPTIGTVEAGGTRVQVTSAQKASQPQHCWWPVACSAHMWTMHQCPGDAGGPTAHSRTLCGQQPALNRDTSCFASCHGWQCARRWLCLSSVAAPRSPHAEQVTAAHSSPCSFLSQAAVLSAQGGGAQVKSASASGRRGLPCPPRSLQLWGAVLVLLGG